MKKNAKIFVYDTRIQRHKEIFLKICNTVKWISNFMKQTKYEIN